MTILRYVDPTGAERDFALPPGRGTVTVGRRREADLSLPWDPAVSRLHVELIERAGEWIIADEGVSQNGTFVNGIRLEGRRRLHDGDLITVGETNLTFCAPATTDSGITLASPDALAPVVTFSEQQRRVLTALCAPLLGDGDGLSPATDGEVATTLELPPRVVVTELDQLARMFGYDDLPQAEARAETALVALRSGIVG
ncbi:MAG: FHA domain-containing protein [Solirubrobacterales bacterium]|nr:FHA domain-containing protein [Solirubrobacterales bacterium]